MSGYLLVALEQAPNLKTGHFPLLPLALPLATNQQPQPPPCTLSAPSCRPPSRQRQAACLYSATVGGQYELEGAREI